MYWNRDIFSSSGLAQPPKTWESLMSQTTKAIVRTDDELRLTQSAVAFGEYENVLHAKEILSMLLMQAGTEIVSEQSEGYRVTLNQAPDNSLSSADAALSFYTQFSSPNSELYSWNRSRGLDRSEFANGTLGMYFGPGSEYEAIAKENANLNFDVTFVPQGSGVVTKRDYGTFYAFAIPRASDNIRGSYAVASYLTSPANVQPILEAYALAPVHRALYTGSHDSFKTILLESALVARGWLDPSPEESGEVFKKMVEGISSGRERFKSVILDAVYGLEALF
jgi:ABC-type glycerol-3-phosphate transport system substrate-binding protein